MWRGAHWLNALTKLEFHTPIGSRSQLASAQSLKTRRVVKCHEPPGHMVKEAKFRIIQIIP